MVIHVYCKVSICNRKIKVFMMDNVSDRFIKNVNPLILNELHCENIGKLMLFLHDV